jgi:hypothetical protein
LIKDKEDKENEKKNNNKKKVTEETEDGKRTKEERIKWLGEGREEKRGGIQGKRIRRKKGRMRTIRIKIV